MRIMTDEEQKKLNMAKFETQDYLWRALNAIDRIEGSVEQRLIVETAIINAMHCLQLELNF